MVTTQSKNRQSHGLRRGREWQGYIPTTSLLGLIFLRLQKKYESLKYVINNETVTSIALTLQNCFRGPKLQLIPSCYDRVARNSQRSLIWRIEFLLYFVRFAGRNFREFGFYCWEQIFADLRQVSVRYLFLHWYVNLTVAISRFKKDMHNCV